MVHPLNSARERLKRAEENIQSLARETRDFLAPAPAIILGVDVDARKPIITDKDRKTFEELRQFIIGQGVPPRFSVLAGEIIHHLRSAFDHVAWQLSSAVFQTNAPTQIEFPIFKERPKLCGITKSKRCRYCRKVEGIARPTALARIETLQPYNGRDASRHQLWRIHDMDRIDKHRELVLAVFQMAVNILGTSEFAGIGQQMPWEIKPRNVRAVGPPTNVKMEAKMSAQITFREVGGRDGRMANLLSQRSRIS